MGKLTPFPPIETLKKNDKETGVLTSFYDHLRKAETGEDNIIICSKVRLGKKDYHNLLEELISEQPPEIKDELTMLWVNVGPGLTETVPDGQILLEPGWDEGS